MNILNLILTFAILGFIIVSSKVIDINRVLRVQMAKIARQYEMQKNTRGHKLKDKGELDSIKANLKADFRKSKNAMIRKLRRQEAQKRRKTINTGQVRTKRNIIDGRNGLSGNKVLQSQMKNLIKEYNTG